ncbi:MAG TPA: hypothetical protein VN428_07705 [Bryobacteraceae bacterium]|nr:hypothetical protein [Bryobacteraceae bacterium]
MNTRRALLVVPVLALVTGCGYVGDPQPPSLEIPVRVIDLGVVERGESLVMTFTLPAQTTDGVPIRRIEEIDLRIGPDTATWEAEAARIEAAAGEDPKVRVEAPAAQWADRDVAVRVRVAVRKERFSEWSEPVRMRVAKPLATPTDVKTEAVAEGVRVTWTIEPGSPQGTRYRVFRGELTLAGTADKNEFIDKATQYGRKYEYTIQAFLKTGETTEAVSEVSAVASVTPVDRFAPATPAGLTVTAGVSAIQLNWEPNSEADLQGYRVYRSAAGGEFAAIGDILPTPNFTDRAVTAGASYSYCVTAIDQNGNESARTATSEATAQ